MSEIRSTSEATQRAISLLAKRNATPAADGKEFPDQLDRVLFQVGKPGSPSSFTVTEKDLTDQAKRQLGKLLDASEQLQAFLFERMFGAMQAASGGKDKEGPMAGLAKDMMTREISLDASRSATSQNVLFRQLADTFLRQEAGRIRQAQSTAAQGPGETR